MHNPAGQFEALWSMRRTADFIVTQSMSRAGYPGLTIGTLRILEMVGDGEDARQIKHSLGCTQQYVSKCIQNLSLQGLATASNHPNDKRMVVYTVSEAGQRVLRLFGEWKMRIAAAVDLDASAAADRLETLARATHLLTKDEKDVRTLINFMKTETTLAG